jgi:hypothetical protein
MNQVALKERDEVTAPANEGEAFLQMVERIARDPNANIEAMERLLAMRERVMAQNAKAAYTAAMMAVKPLLPVIDRKGRIEIRDKHDPNKVLQSTAFAKWEDIDAAIAPTLAEHGFALTFRSGVAPDGKLTVTGIVSHRDGHSEETTVTLPHDGSGSKNAVQAVGSSLSYGKRYAATLLLNIRTKGEDDDGAAGGAAAQTITAKQHQELQALIDKTEANVPRFCQHFKIEGVVDLPAKRFEEAMNLLSAKKQKVPA